MGTIKYLVSIAHVIGWLMRLAQFAALGIALVRTASTQLGPATGLIQMALVILLIWLTRRIAMAGLAPVKALVPPMFLMLANSWFVVPFLQVIATGALLVWVLW